MEYVILGGEAMLTGYSGTKSKLRIPDRHLLYPVTAIGASVFEGNVDLEEVELPPSVRYIGKRAFAGCENLRLVSGHPYAHKEYGVSAFFENIRIDCQGFSRTALKDVMFMGGDVNIAARAFEKCNALCNVVFSTDCHSVRIGPACYRDSGISSFYLPENITLTQLPAEVFSGCQQLENVAFRADYIHPTAFLNCRNLELRRQEAVMEHFGKMKKDLMFEYEDFGTEIKINRIAGRFPTLTIPERIDGKTVCCLGYGSIPEITESLYLPDSIEEVREGVFIHASNLQRISMPGTLLLDTTGLPEGCIIHHRD